ncbi:MULTISPECIES: calcium-binding protein [unclassified Bosea (in: a-proteobacteria)]|uniref:calcium-binding protein n=1 Tax=unclassified Bosea (in: a-proteobacteria) TaxID=2653178 RepID=UPI000F7F7B35|nr:MULTISPECIES: calcium-binding protein [unclassified Bosea (in: a-proteobacteria)]RXT16740.1 hypothetical protein B5U98_27895 [Bosea sp. Tri-39]RXT42339.1 hypothetical protein B5U99_00025 [Bosea sp. Tri-54]
MSFSNKRIYQGVAGRSEIFDVPNLATDIFSFDGDDYIFASAKIDYIEGGSQEDYIIAFGGNDVVYGDNSASGRDGDIVGSLTVEADVILGGIGNDLIFGQSGFDYVNGEGGDDTIFGGLGDDFLQGGTGADTIFGGAGNDTIYGGGTFSVPAGYAKTVNYTNNGISDLPEVSSKASTFGEIGDADTGADVLDGGDGDDTIVGNAGNDYLDGGRGSDTLDGGADNDALLGGSGIDTLLGGAGTDYLDGAADSDQLDGGAGADWLVGGSGFDFARYDGSLNGVVVRLDVGMGVGGDAQGDTLLGVEALTGSVEQDYLIGDGNINHLYGQLGNDWLYGQGGADQLFGGEGSDQLIAGAGKDYSAGGAGNDQYWTLAADFEAGIFDVVDGFGESANNFDYLRFEGIGAGQLTFTNSGSSVVISTTALGGSGGIIVTNFTAAQLGDQLIFA